MESNNGPEPTEKEGESKESFKARAADLFRRYWHLLVLLAITAAAIAVRFHYLAKYTEYTADTYYYMILARSLKNGLGYTVRGLEHTKYLPGFPITTLLFSYIFGGIERSAEIVSVLLGSFTVFTTYGIGKELFNKWTGLAAGLIIAFQPTFLKWTCLPMTEGLFTFLFTLGVYLMIKGCKNGNIYMRLGAALAGGLCLATRWEGVLFLPFLVLMPFFYPKESKMKWWEPYMMLVLYGGPIAVYVGGNIARTGKFSSYVGEFNEHNQEMSFVIFKHRVKVYGWQGMSDALYSFGFYLGALWCLVRKKFKPFLIVGGWFALFVGFHLFWYYSYERFMVPAAPAAAIMIAFLLTDLAACVYKAFKKDGFVAKRWKTVPRFLLAGAQVLGYGLLAACLVLLMWHGLVRADRIITTDCKAFADDHGGVGMQEAANWLNLNAAGQTVAVNAGPYFTWEFESGNVLYMRPVPWDLPVEEKDVVWDDTLRQLEEKDVRYLVLGETEQSYDKEISTFGIKPEERERLREVRRWVDHYDFPEPHDLTTVIFEIMPANHAL